MSGDVSPQPQPKKLNSSYVKLNVGGVTVYSNVKVLSKYNSLLKDIVTGKVPIFTDAEGCVLIDRCGKHFPTILRYLEDGVVRLPSRRKELVELLIEAKYYGIESLARYCEIASVERKECVEFTCSIPSVACHRDEYLIIRKSKQPVIKLLINRHNNKYSYMSNSEDSLLLNLEMFESLALKYNGKIVFIKDVVGCSEVCCWSFYVRGTKVSEVCCTTIVYGEDSKHTKVDYPKKRILEETVSLLAYSGGEELRNPDPRTIPGPSTVPGVIVHYSDDEEEQERSGLDRLRSNKQNIST